MQSTSLEEKVQQLKEQNSEVAKSAQFWRMQCKKMEDEKIILMKENNELNLRNKHYLHKMENYYKLLQEAVCRSMNDWLQFGTYVENIKELIDDHNKACNKPSNESSLSFTTIGSPVHPVRPMIQGITLKTPVLRMSRTNLEDLNTFREPQQSTVTVTTNSPKKQNLSFQTQNMNLRKVTVSLTQMDDNYLTGQINRDSSTRQDPSTSANEDTGSGSSSSGIAFPPCELSVSLSRIDSIPEMRSNREAQREFDDSINDSMKKNNFSGSSNDDSATEEYHGSDCLKYNSRLECIIEESEPNNMSLSKSNVSKRKIDEKKETSELIFDDPLEGPSWKFENSFKSTDESRSFNFITARKKFNPRPCVSPNFKDTEQTPDSTTDGKNFISTSNSEIAHLSPQCQSTPNTSKLDNQNEDDKFQTFIQSPEVKIEKNISPAKSDEDRSVKKSTVSKGKITKGKSKSKTPKNTATVKRHSIRKSDPKKISRQSTSSNGSRRGSNVECTSRAASASLGNVDINGSRPKRGARKDYKEKSIAKKLRRS